MTNSSRDFSVHMNLGKNCTYFSSLNFYFPFQSGDTGAHPTSSDRQEPDSHHCWKYANPLCPFFPSQIARQLSYTENFYRTSSPCAHVIWKHIFQQVSSPTYTMHTTRNNTRCTGTYFLPKQPSETLLLFKRFKYNKCLLSLKKKNTYTHSSNCKNVVIIDTYYKKRRNPVQQKNKQYSLAKYSGM